MKTFSLIICLLLGIGVAEAWMGPIGASTGHVAWPTVGTWDLYWDGEQSWAATELSGNALELDGATDAAYKSDHNDFSFGDASVDSPFSICGWFYRQTHVNYMLLWEKYYEYALALHDTAGTSKLQLGFYDDSGADYVIILGTPGSTGLNSWMFLCQTYNGDETALQSGVSATIIAAAKVWVNGENVTSSGTETNTYVAMHNYTNPFDIGRRSVGGPLYWFDGYLRNLSVWGRELSQTDIRCLMNKADYTAASASCTMTSLVSWWDLNADLNADYSSHNLTGVGTPTYQSESPLSPFYLARGVVLDTALEGISSKQEGSGTVTVVDTNIGYSAISAGEAVITGSATANQVGFVGSAVTREMGTFVLVDDNTTATSQQTTLCFDDSSNLDTTGEECVTQNTTSVYYTQEATAVAIGTAAAEDTKYALVLGGFDVNGVAYYDGATVGDFTYGARMFVRSTTYSGAWTLLWVEPGGSTATLYPQLQNMDADTGTYDNFRVRVDAGNSFYYPYAVDAFTDDDTTDLTAHTMNEGSGWTTRYCDTDADDVNDSYVGTWQIDTNTAEMTAVGSDCTHNAKYRQITTTGVADVITMAKLICETTASHASWLVYRKSDDTANGVNDIILGSIGDGANCDFYAYKNVDGSATALYSDAAGTGVDGTYYTYTVQAIGNTHRYYKDGAKLGADVSEAFNNTATEVGLAVDGNYTDDKAFDTFAVHGAKKNGNGKTWELVIDPYCQ